MSPKKNPVKNQVAVEKPNQEPVAVAPTPSKTAVVEELKAVMKEVLEEEGKKDEEEVVPVAVGPSDQVEEEGVEEEDADKGSLVIGHPDKNALEEVEEKLKEVTEADKGSAVVGPKLAPVVEGKTSASRGVSRRGGFTEKTSTSDVLLDPSFVLDCLSTDLAYSGFDPMTFRSKLNAEDEKSVKAVAVLVGSLGTNWALKGPKVRNAAVLSKLVALWGVLKAEHPVLTPSRCASCYPVEVAKGRLLSGSSLPIAALAISVHFQTKDQWMEANKLFSKTVNRTLPANIELLYDLFLKTLWPKDEINFVQDSHKKQVQKP